MGVRSLGEQLEYLGLLAAHEAAIGDLYRAYAARFPSHASLFSELAAAEREHARWITGFIAEVKQRVVQAGSGTVSTEAVLDSLDAVRALTKEAPTSDLTPEQALALCSELEEALIERQFFEVAETDSPAFQALLTHLSEDTAAHRDSLRQAREAAGGE